MLTVPWRVRVNEDFILFNQDKAEARRLSKSKANERNVTSFERNDKTKPQPREREREKERARERERERERVYFIQLTVFESPWYPWGKYQNIRAGSTPKARERLREQTFLTPTTPPADLYLPNH